MLLLNQVVTLSPNQWHKECESCYIRRLFFVIFESTGKELSDYTVTTSQQLILLITLSNMIDQNTWR